MFSIGDIVVLKSGSPIMTVAYINNEGNVTCQWFLDGDVKSHSFHPQTLETYDSEQDDF
ncbi:DUF2158 domain-containing protein [Vibrio natriegens]|uniref:YodC family protein n=1 Tax=Vibrio natriegens TaxID=691 RepID=UPI002284FCAE|nr:DUF2158 domain-containing protein [Vibrio natriegens]MCY9875899.1 DUF2158 domain-containing protein [Vibrio natriegens]